MTEVRLGDTRLTNPPALTALFTDLRLAWVWIPVRLFLAYEWLHAAIEKIESPAWTQTGLALKGFWVKAVAMPPPPARPPIAFDWYRSFLQMLLDHEAYTWFAKIIYFSELAFGIALLLGAFVGVAALFAGFMNWNFIMAGTASVNGMLIVLSVLLVLAWRTAGYWGLDRWILKRLGTPWDASGVFAPPTPGIGAVRRA